MSIRYYSIGKNDAYDIRGVRGDRTSLTAPYFTEMSVPFMLQGVCVFGRSSQGKVGTM